MKANELRIGNLVHLNGELLKISEDDFGEIFGRYSCLFEDLDIKPIPITEEWLERFRFLKDTTLKNVWFEKKIPSQYLSVCIELKRFVIGEAPDWTYPLKIEYVHQLQNLYFALTSQELEISE